MQNDDRVTLQYSIKLQELPHEVGRLINKASSMQCEQIAKKFKKFSMVEDYDFLSESFLYDIQQLRYMLSSLDASLSDIDNIVAGYLSMEREEPVELPEDGTLTTENFDELSEGAEELVEKLRLFREKDKLKNAEEPTPGADEQPV
jgi:hypothetical protein